MGWAHGALNGWAHHSAGLVSLEFGPPGSCQSSGSYETAEYRCPKRLSMAVPVSTPLSAVTRGSKRQQPREPTLPRAFLHLPHWQCRTNSFLQTSSSSSPTLTGASHTGASHASHIATSHIAACPITAALVSVLDLQLQRSCVAQALPQVYTCNHTTIAHTASSEPAARQQAASNAAAMRQQ